MIARLATVTSPFRGSESQNPSARRQQQSKASPLILQCNWLPSLKTDATLDALLALIQQAFKFLKNGRYEYTNHDTESWKYLVEYTIFKY